MPCFTMGARQEPLVALFLATDCVCLGFDTMSRKCKSHKIGINNKDVLRQEHIRTGG